MGKDASRMVIIGTGLAGVGAATTLRAEGFDGAVTLIGSDPANPYDHVPLSKDYLRGEQGYHRLFPHDESFYGHAGIDLRRGTTVGAVDVASHEVELTTGERIVWERLLIATGSRNRRLDTSGAELEGILQLRTLAEADRLKAELSRPGRLVVVGSGFIGCEIAASARQLGWEVTLVGRGPLPMLHALGPLASRFYLDLHASKGVALRMNSDVAAFEGVGGKVTDVVLGDGTRLPADLVVVGVGAVPNVELAAAAGILVDGGIVTDATLATSAPDVYAAGDVASVPYQFLGQRLRVEHFATALTQGPVAARNMLGASAPYRGLPFFFTDQFDVWMEYTGHGTPDCEQVVQGDVAGGEFVVSWLREGHLMAAMNVGIKGIPDLATPLILSGRRFDPAELLG